MDIMESPAWEISLINPDGFLKAEGRKRPVRRILPPIGLAYVAASLERNGEHVRVLDAGCASHQEAQRFLSLPADLTGITATSFTFREALAAARAVKTRYPSMPVLMGGPHVAIDPASCFAENTVDYAVIGEGEETVVDLLEVLKRFRQPTPEVLGQIPGLVFLDNREPRVNSRRPRRRNLDLLPFPAWHLFPMDRYEQHALLTSRGCPMDCGFCAVNAIWGRQWVHRTPEQAVAEIDWIIQRWGVKLIHINDDNLTMNPEHAGRFCDEILRRKLRVNWVAQGVRADAVQPDLLRKMRRAGCHRISLGIESADPKVLEAIGKKESPEEIAQAIRMCREAGIQVLGMFMVGNPGDTAESVRASIRFAKDADIDLPAFYMALPYPGTRLWDFAQTQGMGADYTRFDHMSSEPVFATPEFGLEDRRQVFAEAEKFCRRQWLAQHLKFWWPPRLAKRNAYEIGEELAKYFKLLLRPFGAGRRH